MTKKQSYFKAIFPFVVIFIFSFVAGAISEKIFSQDTTLQENSYTTIQELPIITGYATEKLSPQDWISEDNIKVYNDKVIIYIDNPHWAKFADTNSMDPLFDQGSNAIQIKPEKPEMIIPGDIISFEYKNSTIIHRIIETGYDNKGWFAITKGDNNPREDPVKIRFNQIKKVLIAIIY